MRFFQAQLFSSSIFLHPPHHFLSAEDPWVWSCCFYPLSRSVPSSFSCCFCLFTLSTNLCSCDQVTPSAMMHFIAFISPLPYSVQFWALSFSLAWEYESMNSNIYLHIEIGQEQIYADSKFSHIWEDKQHSQLVQKLLSLGSHCLATRNSYRGTDEAASKFWRKSFYSNTPQTLQTATIFSCISVQLLNLAEAQRSDSQLDFLAAGINTDSPSLKD